MAKSTRRRKAAAPQEPGRLAHLPDELRQAIEACPFRIETPLKLRRGLDLAALADQVRQVKSEEDADEVNRVIATQINR